MHPISRFVSGGPLRRCAVAVAAQTTTRRVHSGPAPPLLLLVGFSPLLRLLHSSSSAAGFGSHVSDNDPLVLEREKEAQVAKGDHAPWNELLASDSEAMVKADRMEINVAEIPPDNTEPKVVVEEMTRFTIKSLQGNSEGEDDEKMRRRKLSTPPEPAPPSSDPPWAT